MTTVKSVKWTPKRRLRLRKEKTGRGADDVDAMYRSTRAVRTGMCNLASSSFLDNSSGLATYCS